MSGCSGRVPCDTSSYLRFGTLALVLTVVGPSAPVLAASVVVAAFVRGVVRLDARERTPDDRRSDPRQRLFAHTWLRGTSGVLLKGLRFLST